MALYNGSLEIGLHVNPFPESENFFDSLQNLRISHYAFAGAAIHTVFCAWIQQFGYSLIINLRFNFGKKKFYSKDFYN